VPSSSAIALLVACQLRLGTFVRLEIGSTLSRTGDSWTIHLPGTRGTKYRRPVEKPVPDALRPFLERWISCHRSCFPGAEQHQRLWPSQRGVMTISQAYRVICARTHQAFGHAVNPHLFRDCAATTINTEFGAEAHLASTVLDHVGPRTTEKYYNQARMVDAVTALQRHLQLRD
jgi:integrase/recombinase XerD